MRNFVFALGVLSASAFCDAAIIPFWRENPISQAAIDDSGGLLQFAYSQSLMVRLTNGSQFNVAGLDLTSVTGGERFYHRIGGGASNNSPPAPEDVALSPALAFDTYVCTAVPFEPAATSGRLNGSGTAQIGDSNFQPTTGRHRSGQFVNVAWSAIPNNGTDGEFEIARLTQVSFQGFVLATAPLSPSEGFVADSLQANAKVFLPPIRVISPEPGILGAGVLCVFACTLRQRRHTSA